MRTHDLTLKLRPVDELFAYAKNARTHSDAQVAEIAASLTEYGFTNPVLVDEAGSIIAGHGRVLAARRLALQAVPTLTLRGLSEQQKRAYRLADNRFAEKAGWDAALVLEELEYLKSKAFDVALAGWSEDEFQAMLEVGRVEPDSDSGDGDEVPDPPKDPVTKLGDVWCLGPHRLICGDGTKVNERFGMVVTDPPYGISIVRDNKVAPDFKGLAKKGRYEPIAGDDAVPRVGWLLERARDVVIWGGNYFADQLPPTGGWLVWDKRDDSGIENSFADVELAWSNRTGPARVHRQLWNGMIRSGEKGKRVHPTQKPVALMAWCVGFGEGVVFDPYAGSGSTLIACEQIKRHCVAVELSPAYCDVVVARWEALTGGKATRKTG